MQSFTVKIDRTLPDAKDYYLAGTFTSSFDGLNSYDYEEYFYFLDELNSGVPIPSICKVIDNAKEFILNILPLMQLSILLMKGCNGILINKSTLLKQIAQIQE